MLAVVYAASAWLLLEIAFLPHYAYMYGCQMPEDWNSF
jgi:hypothetical protein